MISADKKIMQGWKKRQKGVEGGRRGGVWGGTPQRGRKASPGETVGLASRKTRRKIIQVGGKNTVLEKRI
jgi:hypothetical protein